jgi:biotin carboxylase
VVASDIHPDAPCFALSDARYCVDVRDVAGTLAIARDERVDAIVTGVDLAVPTAARVADALRLPGLAPEVADSAADKYLTRSRLAELGIDAPAFRAVGSSKQAADAAESFGWPCVVKPPDNCGSRGVVVVDRPGLIEGAFSAARTASFSGRVLVEEFMTGVESSVEGFVQDGELHILGVCDKTKSALPYRFDLALHYPGAFSPAQLAAVEAYTRAVVRGLGIDRGAIHAELMITGNRVRLIEIAARGCGAFVIGRLIPVISGFDVMGALLAQALGSPVAVPQLHRRHGLLKFVVMPPGTVTAVGDIEAVRRMPGVIDAGLDLKVGDAISVATNTTGRQGHLLLHGESRSDVESCAAQALERLEIRVDTSASTPQGPGGPNAHQPGSTT